MQPSVAWRRKWRAAAPNYKNKTTEIYILTSPQLNSRFFFPLYDHPSRSCFLTATPALFDHFVQGHYPVEGLYSGGIT